MFAAGILLLALALIPGESVWTFFTAFLFGLFSFGIFLLAPSVIYIAILCSTDRPFKNIKHKIWQLSLLLLLFAAPYISF